MKSLVRFFLPFMSFFAASSLFRFLGSGGTSILSGPNIVLLGTTICFFICLFRRYSFHIYEKYGKKIVLIIYFSFLLLTAAYCSILRIFICENGIPFFMELFSFFGAVSVLGQPLPLPSPSNSSSDSSQARWDAFDMEVLLEGWPVARDFELETSIRSRISALENSGCVFLLDQPRGDFWNQVKEGLEGCTTQMEYNQKLCFENRDLQVREQRQSCYTVFKQLLSEHPSLAGSAAYDPSETVRDFFNESRDSMDRRYALNLLGPRENSSLLGTLKKPSEVDTEERVFLQEVEGDLRDRGVNSVYIRRLLGHSSS